MFNHHPDVLHYAYKAFTELGHDVDVATEGLAKGVGFQYSSTKDNKFEVVDQLYEPEDLYPNIGHVNFSSSMEGYDIYWSMLPEITQLFKHGKMTWFDAQMQLHLTHPGFGELPGIKTCNHPDGWKRNKFHFMSNWVDNLIGLEEPKYMVQLVTQIDKVPTTPKLRQLRDQGEPVKIYGGSHCPDGFVKDIDILPYTSVLVHDKQFGINCYAVCKALAIGIPVYMSRETRNLIGFGNLPEHCFIFSEEVPLEKALAVADTMDRKAIANSYNTTYTLEATKGCVTNILDTVYPELKKQLV